MDEFLTTHYIISQILTTFYYGIFAATYFIRGRRNLLLTAISGNVSMITGFALLNGWVGLWTYSIAICRDVVSYITNSRRKDADKMKTTHLDFGWLVVWLSLLTVATWFTQTGLWSLFAYFCVVTYTISIWQKNIFIYRLLGIFTVLLEILYNVGLKNISGVVYGTILLMFVIAGFVSYIKDRKSKNLDLLR